MLSHNAIRDHAEFALAYTMNVPPVTGSGVRRGGDILPLSVSITRRAPHRRPATGRGSASVHAFRWHANVTGDQCMRRCSTHSSRPIAWQIQRPRVRARAGNLRQQCYVLRESDSHHFRERAVLARRFLEFRTGPCGDIAHTLKDSTDFFCFRACARHCLM